MKTEIILNKVKNAIEDWIKTNQGSGLNEVIQRVHEEVGMDLQLDTWLHVFLDFADEVGLDLKEKQIYCGAMHRTNLDFNRTILKDTWFKTVNFLMSCQEQRVLKLPSWSESDLQVSLPNKWIIRDYEPRTLEQWSKIFIINKKKQEGGEVEFKEEDLPKVKQEEHGLMVTTQRIQAFKDNTDEGYKSWAGKMSVIQDWIDSYEGPKWDSSGEKIKNNSWAQAIDNNADMIEFHAMAFLGRHDWWERYEREYKRSALNAYRKAKEKGLVPEQQGNILSWALLGGQVQTVLWLMNERKENQDIAFIDKPNKKEPIEMLDVSRWFDSRFLERFGWILLMREVPKSERGWMSYGSSMQDSELKILLDVTLNQMLHSNQWKSKYVGFLGETRNENHENQDSRITVQECINEYRDHFESITYHPWVHLNWAWAWEVNEGKSGISRCNSEVEIKDKSLNCTGVRNVLKDWMIRQLLHTKEWNAVEQLRKETSQSITVNQADFWSLGAPKGWKEWKRIVQVSNDNVELEKIEIQWTEEERKKVGLVLWIEAQETFVPLTGVVEALSVRQDRWKSWMIRNSKGMNETIHWDYIPAKKNMEIKTATINLNWQKILLNGSQENYAWWKANGGLCTVWSSGEKKVWLNRQFRNKNEEGFQWVGELGLTDEEYEDTIIECLKLGLWKALEEILQVRGTDLKLAGHEVRDWALRMDRQQWDRQCELWKVSESHLSDYDRWVALVEKLDWVKSPDYNGMRERIDPKQESSNSGAKRL